MSTQHMPQIGEQYHWPNQSERLAYMGARRYPGDPRTWHQFEKIEEPGVVWSEVLTAELALMERTNAKDTGSASVKTVLELIADYREMLRAIGAMEDDMASVPAVGVRALLDDIEAAVREDWWSEHQADKNGGAA